MKYCQPLILISLWLILAICPLAGAQDVPPAKITPADKCPVCGMFVAKYPDFVDQIVFKDGTHAFFDGVKDMMKYYFDLPKYNPGKTIVGLKVTGVNQRQLWLNLQENPVTGKKSMT